LTAFEVVLSVPLFAPSFPVVPTCSESATLAAEPIPLFGDVKIVTLVRVAFRAMRFCQPPLPGRSPLWRKVPALDVDSVRDCLQMFRVDASTVATQMVDLQPFGDFTDEEFVCDTVSQSRPFLRM